MKRTRLKSDKLISIGYDQDERILEVEYKTKGVYHFINVPSQIYQSMREPWIESPDDFFSKIIECNYAFYKVN